MTTSLLALLVLLALGVQLAHPIDPVLANRRCISPPCDLTTLDVDGLLHDGMTPDSDSVFGARSFGAERAVHARSLASLLGGLAPLAAATSDLLAGVATLGFAANNPYYNPWYGGYGGGYGVGYGGYSPGYGYGTPFRPFPYFR